MKWSVLSGGCFELTDGWVLLIGCQLLIGRLLCGPFAYWVNWWLLCGRLLLTGLIGGYCAGSFVYWG